MYILHKGAEKSIDFYMIQNIICVDMSCILDTIFLVKMLLAGMGNRDRGDDGFGSYIIDNIQESDRLRKIDCSIYPENYLNKIVDETPDLVIFFDTAKIKGSKAVLLKDEDILENNPISISTHNLPFSSIYEYIKVNTQAKIWFLGIAPISYEKMSLTTEKIAQKIINTLKFIDKQEKLNIIKIYETLSTTLK